MSAQAKKKVDTAASVLLRDCIRLKKNEKILILTDEHSMDLIDVLWHSAMKVTERAFVVKIGSGHGKRDLMSPLLSTLSAIDVLLIACEMKLRQPTELRRLLDQGTRIAYLPSLRNAISKRSLNINYKKLELASKKIADIFSIGENIEISNGNGTHLRLSVKQEKGASECGQIRSKGTFAVLPGGLAHIRPIPGTCNGLVVVDGSIDGVGLVSEPIKLKFKDGRLTRIYGNQEAQLFRKRLRDKTQEANHLVRIGIGTNHNAKISGHLFEDVTALGRVHLGIGLLRPADLATQASDTLMVSLRNAELQIDGKSVVRKGKVLF